jgi:hypothetical protein
MSIFAPPAPARPTPAQQAAARFNMLVQQGAQLLNQQARLVRDAWIFVWKNRTGLTPQQVCDLIQTAAAASGSTCVQIFASHQAAVVYLNEQVPGIVPEEYTAVPKGVAYTVNPDGSLTLTMPAKMKDEG